jgi:hypothetical protein
MLLCLQVKQEYSSDSGSVPDYVKNVMSNERTLQRNRIVFAKQKPTYDAYLRDIAILQVFPIFLIFGLT